MTQNLLSEIETLRTQIVELQHVFKDRMTQRDLSFDEAKDMLTQMNLLNTEIKYLQENKN